MHVIYDARKRKFIDVPDNTGEAMVMKLKEAAYWAMVWPALPFIWLYSKLS